MHDWTLKGIELKWGEGIATLLLEAESGDKFIIARGFVELIVPQRQEWGPSSSVMGSSGSTSCSDQQQRLEIEMQSGDVLTIVAREIEMPG